MGSRTEGPDWKGALMILAAIGLFVPVPAMCAYFKIPWFSLRTENANNVLESAVGLALVSVSPEQWEAALAGLQAWGRRTSPADHGSN